MALKNVCLVGANGTLGSVILQALVASNSFHVSVLRRANSSSSSSFPKGVKSIPVDPDFTIPNLTSALRGQDAVIASFPLPNSLHHHLRLAYASASAGVRRFIPADFGSCDAASPEALRRLQLYRDKIKVREKCVELTREFPDSFTWTGIVCGHFFDTGLEDGMLHVDLEAKSVKILDGGNVKVSASTLGRVAEAVVRILQREEATANRTLFLQSFNPTQREVLTALEKATGGASWKVDERDSRVFLDDLQKELVDGNGDYEVIKAIVFALGTIDADWTQKEGFAMDLLGLEDENLDEVVTRVVKEHAARKTS
jgi:hypothetical protein